KSNTELISRSTTLIGPTSGFDSLKRTRGKRSYTLDSQDPRAPTSLGINDRQLALIPSAAPGLLPGVTMSRIRSLSSLRSNRNDSTEHSGGTTLETQAGTSSNPQSSMWLIMFYRVYVEYELSMCAPSHQIDHLPKESTDISSIYYN
ncbi:hypothetical protein K7432_015098, partial [Basidiobolus ranarum]